MDELKSTLSMCHLVDIGFKGDKFTWKRRDKKGDMIKERLDRFVANPSMINKAQNLEVSHLSYHNSDHRPILATWHIKDKQAQRKFKKRKPKFEESWLVF